jgi:hypothetical protein
VTFVTDLVTRLAQESKKLEEDSGEGVAVSGLADPSQWDKPDEQLLLLLLCPPDCTQDSLL